ncbi:hypothetical protein GCM10020220_102410 [Nonomuraea rubra]
MYLMRIGAPGAEKPVVRVDDTHYIDVSDVTPDFDERFFAAGGPALLADRVSRGDTREFAGERIGAPIARPHQILCIGLNYSDHAAETGQAVPEEPILFTKSPNTLVGPYDDVRIPRGSTKTDWEVELGIVIGRRTSYLDSAEEAKGRDRRVLRGQRRQRARLPDGARRPVEQGQVRRDVQPGRAVAGHAGRARRREEPRHVAGRQRRAPPDRHHQDDDLRPVRHRAPPEPVHGPGAG